MRLLIILFFFILSSCQFSKKPPTQPALVKDLSIEKKINPVNLEKSVIETLPLMNNAVKSLYQQAKNHYSNKLFDQAIVSLERAYEIQPQAPEVSQLLSEISLHQGNHKQAHYWADIATKNGPAKGVICEKSWRILAIAAEKLGYNANKLHALKQQEECLVKLPKRY